MSDIGTDTREIAVRMMPWDSPPTYTSKEVPDWELLRVHALRLADAFHEVRDRWQVTGRQLAAAIEGIAELETDLETMTRTAAHQGDLLDQAQTEAKRLLAIVERYREHLRRMQADATTYLIPDLTDCGRDWFISRILWHLDGPQGRAIEALAEKGAER